MRSPMHTRLSAPLLVGVLAMAMALALAGCGGGDDGTAAAPTSAAAEGRGASDGQRPRPAAITLAQVRRAPAGTPRRTVLEWWRDVQLNEPARARSLYVDPPTYPDLAGQFNFVAGWLDGSVRIAETQMEGDVAVLSVRWRRPDGEARTVTMRLEEEGGRWKLLDARFLDEMVAARQRAEGDGEGAG